MTRLVLALDTEFELVNPAWAKLAGFSYSWAEGSARYMAPSPEALAHLQEQLDAADIVVGHNVPVDCLVLENVGIKVPYAKLHDTILMSAVLQEEELGLKALAYKHFRVLMTDLDEIIGTGKKRRDPTTVPVEEIWDYACADADMTRRLFLFQAQRLAAIPALEYIYETMERPCLEAVVAMQRNGVLLDWEKFKELEVELEGMVQSLCGTLQNITGNAKFNPNAHQQVQHFLYDLPPAGLGLPPQHNIKTDALSGDERSIMALRERKDHPFLATLLDYRGKFAMLTRYLRPFPALADCNGWLHPTFKLFGAQRTGRMASADPNFQNIPVRS